MTKSTPKILSLMEIVLNDAPSSRVDGRKRGFRNYQLTNGYEVTVAPSRLFTIIHISSIIHLWPRSYPLIPFRRETRKRRIGTGRAAVLIQTVTDGRHDDSASKP